MDHRPVECIAQPHRPLEVGDLVVVSGGVRCRVVALRPQDHGDGFQTVQVELELAPDDAPPHGSDRPHGDV